MNEAHSPERWMAENDYNGDPQHQESWDSGPCYICGEHVPPHLGWHREDFDGVSRHWCPDHQPVWSRGA